MLAEQHVEKERIGALLVIFPSVSARIITLLLLTVEDKNFDKSATFVVAF